MTKQISAPQPKRVLECQIEKLVSGGNGLGRVNGKVILVGNALPGERVQVSVLEEKKDYLEAETLQVLEPSAQRIEPVEDHFYSCSPWQIMTLDCEQHWKIEIARELFNRFCKLPLDFTIHPLTEHQRFSYRNKLEFNFMMHQGTLSFAMLQRGTHNLQPVCGCLLGESRLNQMAHNILEWLQARKIEVNQLRKLIVRTCTGGAIQASLFIHSSHFPQAQSLFEKTGLAGLWIYEETTNRKHPRLIKQLGIPYLEEVLRHRVLRYGDQAFFQINVFPLNAVLEDILPFVRDEHLVDYYGGVGALGIGLADAVRSCMVVESDRNAVAFASANIALNHLTHYQALHGRSETLPNYIEGDKVILVDPPRAGLDAGFCNEILKKLPKRLIYLSCNPSTCTRDVSRLLGAYRPVFWKLYNFFPATPHFETLLVLER
ncbi:MAG: class I SAM-dependent RNA methyltransferase [SAR324 cluster bacterium]|nr:class I SAM-dependent RNA methyltransferase [SAR324 cluster bacterium]